MQWRKRPGFYNAGIAAIAALSAATASQKAARGQQLIAANPDLISVNSTAFAPSARPNPLLPAVTLATTSIDTTWIVNRSNSSSWINPANWDQFVVPNGPTDVARFGESSGGPIVDLSNASVQLSTLAFTDPLFASVTGNGTINLTGQAIIFADGGNFDLPEKVYQTFGSSDPTNPRPGNNLSVAIVGSSGLTKSGDSHLQIDAPQYYTGSTTIGGGKIITTVGDSAFGSAANSIFLSNGSIQVASTDWTSSRTITVGAGAGTETSEGSIYWVGNNRKVDLFGNISGVGTLHLNGFYGSPVGSAVFHAGNSFTGTLHIGGGSVALRDSGAFANLGTTNTGTAGIVRNAIINGGTLVLDNSNSGSSIDRIGNLTPINMRGSALTFIAGATPYQESIGTLVLDGGVSFLTVQPGTGGASIGFSFLNRTDKYSGSAAVFGGAGLVFRGANLGSTPGPNNANIFINGSSGTLLNQNGLIPFAYGNASFTSTTTPESVDNGLVVYDPTTGVKPVTQYDPDFVFNLPTRNVRISLPGGSGSLSTFDAGTTAVNANAIVMSAPATFVANSGSNTVTGMTLGGALIHVRSGVVLSANAGSTGTLGTTNTIPGNIISANLDFGSSMGEIMTPAALTLSGAISGTAGLAKLGGRTAVFSGGSTYTGKTYLTGFTRFVGNVWADGFTPNPFGLDLSPIVLYGGNASPTNPNTGSFNGTGFGQLGSDSPGTTNFNRNLELRGDRVMLRSFGDGTLLWNGNITVPTRDPALGIEDDAPTMLNFLSSKSTAHMVVNGGIVGNVQVIIGSSDTSDPLSPTWVDLMHDGTFSGGLVLAGGTIGIGNDNALGHYFRHVTTGSITTDVDTPGTVQVSGNTLMTALGGSRVLSNPFVVYGNTLGIGNSGTNAITLAGPIDGRGGDYAINVTSSVPTVLSGTLTGGGMVKTGSGTLVLTGNNTLTGVISVGNGSTQGGALVVQSSTALGATVGPTVVDYGTSTITIGTTTFNPGQQNQLILDYTGTGSLIGGGLNIGDETIYLRGFGIANTGALRNKTGNNVISGAIRPTPAYSGGGTATVSLLSQAAGIGVDPGSSLTASGGILVDDDPGVKNSLGTTSFLANAISLRKVGTGTLIVGSQPLGSSTFTWNAAINATGSLEIQAGTVQIKSQTGISTISGGRSVVSVSSINLGGTLASPVGKLDLTDNGLIVNYTSSSPLATIRQYLKAGYGTGPTVWSGTGGITSSTADSAIYSAGKITLGYADTASLSMSTLFGHPLDSTAVVVRTAYAGDSNLDGKVDVTDLTTLAMNWPKTANPPTNLVWTNGDFNYDGSVNISDLLLMAMNWQAGVGNALPGADLSTMLATLNLPSIQVPEPATFALSGISLAGMLLRRRRSTRRKLPKFTFGQ